MKVLVAFLEALSLLLIQINCASFSYDDTRSDGPKNWWKISPACNGPRQSPINIDTNLVMKASYCNPLKVFNIFMKTISVDLINSGHGASMDLKYQSGSAVHIFGGPLRQPHTLKNFHLHWPAEHTVDGKRYPAELHLVHYNEKYGSFEAAASQPDGLAVLGFFFEVSDSPNLPKPNNYLKLFKNILNDMTQHTVTDAKSMLTLYDVIRSANLNIWSYLGSLTTPGCNENVLWMISQTPLPITQAELNDLKKIKFDTGMKIDANFRPVQKLLTRKVLVYTQE